MNDRQRSDIFSLKEALPEASSGGQIYSIGGTPSGRINRLRGTGSNVFPVGCMGTVEQPLKEDKRSFEPRAILEEPMEKILLSPKREPEAGDAEVASIPDSPGKEAKPKRNPLTGEGIQSSDMPKSRSARKKVELTKFLY